MVPKVCDVCGAKKGFLLRRARFTNGSLHFFWQCQWCTKNAQGSKQWIKKATVEEWLQSGKLKANSLDDIPIAIDYITGDVSCVVCGQPAVEYHHFAPQALSAYFGDEWARYPTTYFCKKHHDLWHNVVTWYYPKSKNSQIASEIKQRYNIEGAS